MAVLKDEKYWLEYYGKKIEQFEDYELLEITEYGNDIDSVHGKIRHKVCGYVKEGAIRTFVRLQAKGKEQCSVCGAIPKNMTEDVFQMRLDRDYPGTYNIVDFRGWSARGEGFTLKHNYCGYEFDTTGAIFKRRVIDGGELLCANCSKKRKYTFEEIKDNFYKNTKGWELLSTTYSDSSLTDMQFKHECGNIVERSYHTFMNNYNKATDRGKLYCDQCRPYKIMAMSAGHKLLEEILTENDIKFETEKKFDDLVSGITGFHLRYDFYLEDSNTILEYDGEQHHNYFSTLPADGENTIQYRDNLKNEYAEKNGINLIRINNSKIRTHNASNEDIKTNIVNLLINYKILQKFRYISCRTRE